MAARKRSLLGDDYRKAAPKLRMIADSAQEVNELRARLASSVGVSEKKPLEAESAPEPRKATEGRKSASKPPTIRNLAPDIELDVFIGFDKEPPEEGAQKAREEGRDPRVDSVTTHSRARGTLSTARITLSQLKELLKDEDLAYVELGERLTAPISQNDEVAVGPGEISERRFDGAGAEGVLVGIIDVEGFDFAHADFSDGEGGTRFVSIWDQGEGFRPAPSGFHYGSELLKESLDDAIDLTDPSRPDRVPVAPTDLEPQSQMVPGSHGTHVASIAAGNRGVAHKAWIAGVVVSLATEDTDRRRSFSDSTRLVDAVEYLLDVAERLREEKELERTPPIAINISLGTNGHAHDGTSASAHWIDGLLGTPGRCVCIAAGNAGQEAPEHPDDIGYVMGRIHTGHQVPARGLSVDIDWTVVGNGIEDLSENELEVWYSPADRFSVQLRLPNGEWMEEIVGPGQFIENRHLDDYGTFVSIYNELYHPANGHNTISIYLSPRFDRNDLRGVPAGIWTVKLIGEEVRDGSYHAWIERDDPRPLGRVGERSFWRFPSFFTADSNVDSHSIGSIACGQHTIAVANLSVAEDRINVSSSQGPTRDGRPKPDVAAPGTGIVAARGFDPEQSWVRMSGTSMASPYACGVSALMLHRQPGLTAAQIRGILQRTARPLPGEDYSWKDDAGYGVIHAPSAIDEASKVNEREELR